MNRKHASIYLLLVLASSVAFCQESKIQKQTQSFLEAYAKGDRQAVLSLVDPNIDVYGSDVAEVTHGSAALQAIMEADQQLWGGAASIGKMEHVSIIQNGALASVFFDTSFSVGGRPPLPIRFAMTWKREGKRWLLIQSSNVVPTQHQSANELLHPAAAQ